MSNFRCLKCGRDNIDGGRDGYTGCECDQSEAQWWATPQWVRVCQRNDFDYVSMDQANHPLNPEKATFNLNTSVQYYRSYKYPFWVVSRHFYKSYPEGGDHGGFVQSMREYPRSNYEALCRLWEVCPPAARGDLMLLSRML